MEHKGRRVVLRDILSAEDGDFLQQFESGGITYAVAVIDIRIDEYLHPHTVYVWDMTQDLT